MKLKTFTRLVALAGLLLAGQGTMAQERNTMTIFNRAKFYDGYLLDKNPDSLVQDGILRHRTSLYAVKMTDEQLSQIGDSLEMDVSVRSCCDNYDRIGNINLAFVPKGQERYVPDSVQRIEIGRFITPFMDKNKMPREVPYHYSVPYLSYILNDSQLRGQYDIWVEFELFGVPYAAQQQIRGCANRSDVFLGSLFFSTLKPAQPQTDKDVLVSIVIKKPEYMGRNLDNYDSLGTDTIGKTTKTYHYTVPRDVADAQLVIVTSNHGANSGGEEYNRRWHYIYVDDRLALVYKPGRSSCEPFRQYNTQANGIYQTSAMTDEQWQSFSNWCPGDVIDNRIVALGPVKAGEHKVRISVPDAVFNGKQGDIPVSIFFQGLTEGTLNSIQQVKASAKAEMTVKQTGSMLVFGGKPNVMSAELRDMQGKLILQTENQSTMNVAACQPGIYLVSLELTDGILETHKIVIKK